MPVFLSPLQHFLLRYGGSSHYWVGLRREGSGPWRWFNGSFFTHSYVPSCSGEQSLPWAEAARGLNANLCVNVLRWEQ